MANMLGLIGAVRRKCNNYAPQDGPDEGLIAEYLLEVIDSCVNELNLSVPSWYLPRFTITVSSGLDETPITQVGDFGRSYLVLTSPPTSAAYDTRVVDTVDAAALYRYYGAGDRNQMSTASANTSWAMACAFTYHDGQHWFQVAPTPIGAADYQILYEPDKARPQNIADEAFRLPQFDSYITDMAALRVLPYIKMEPSMKSGIAATLTTLIARGDIQFRRFRQSDRNNDRVQAIPWGQNRWRRRRR